MQLLSVLAGHPEVPHPSSEERGHLCRICADGVHRAQRHPVPCHHSCSVGCSVALFLLCAERLLVPYQPLDGRAPLHSWGPSAEVTPLCSPSWVRGTRPQRGGSGCTPALSHAPHHKFSQGVRVSSLLGLGLCDDVKVLWD